MSFFLSQDVLLSEKLLEIIYIIMGAVAIYTGIKNARDKANATPIGTAIFWCALGIVMMFGRWIPPMINGVLVILMTLPPIFKKVNKGKRKCPNRSCYEENGGQDRDENLHSSLSDGNFRDHFRGIHSIRRVSRCGCRCFSRDC